MEKFKHPSHGFNLPQTSQPREYRPYPLVVNISPVLNTLNLHNDAGHKEGNRYNPVDRWEDDLPRELRSSQHEHLGMSQQNKL